jgi:hypothetical protein
VLCNHRDLPPCPLQRPTKKSPNQKFDPATNHSAGSGSRDGPFNPGNPSPNRGCVFPGACSPKHHHHPSSTRDVGRPPPSKTAHSLRYPDYQQTSAPVRQKAKIQTTNARPLPQNRTSPTQCFKPGPLACTLRRGPTKPVHLRPITNFFLPPGGLPPSSQLPPPAMSSCLPPLSRLFFLRPKRLAAPPPPPAVPVPKTHVYSSPCGVDLRVDLYAPSAPITPSPVIIFFHGGQLLYGARDFVIAALRGVCVLSRGCGRGGRR